MICLGDLCNKDEVRCDWLEGIARLVPPSTDTLHCELDGLMINTHIHKAALVDYVVDPRGDGFAISLGHNVIRIDAVLYSFGLPFPSVVL
jgi:hypothetical protein